MTNHTQKNKSLESAQLAALSLAAVSLDSLPLAVEHGVLFLHKPTGITSHTAIQKIKYKHGIKKIGHVGTLDKFAEGLLIVLLGKATRLNDLYVNLSKTYRATLCFGQETDTLDIEGEVIERKDIPTEKKIREVCAQYIGEIEQTPPQYSAVHVQGKRAYQIARSGGVADIPSRRVTIYRNDVMNLSLPYLTIDCHVSKGTYMRALARDIGHACGSCAYLSALERTHIEEWSVAEALGLEEVLGMERLLEGKGIISVETMLEQWKDSVIASVENDTQLRANMMFGKQPMSLLAMHSADEYGILGIRDEVGLVGVWKSCDGVWKQLFGM